MALLSQPQKWWGRTLRLTVAVIFAVCLPALLAAQQLTPDERERIDSGALAVLDATGAPSASIAIVRGGEIVYERGYGDGRIDPKTPAMRYGIGSISKAGENDGRECS